MSAKRIMIVDQPLIVEGLRLVLKDHFSVVGVCSDQARVMAMSAELQPDLMLMDPIVMDSGGMDLVHRIRTSQPGTKIMFLSQHLQRFTLRQAVQVGVTGFVLMQQQPEELFHAIHRVAKGNAYVAPQLRRELLFPREMKSLRHETGSLLLTPRQQEVLSLMAHGRTNKEIGNLLSISTKTVEFHRASIADTLGLRTVAELSRYAMQTGLVGPAA